MTDVIVIGQSLPALQSALDFAEVGLQVTVVRTPVAPRPTPAGDRDADGVIRAFYERIAMPIEGTEADANTDAMPRLGIDSSPRLLDRKGNWSAQPTPNVLGIPAVPLAERTIALLGAGAAVRAYLDRITPLLTVGKTQWFGNLVRKRLGAAALSRLVEPQVFERFGVSALDVEAAIAAPGLNESLSRAGALTSAVLAYSDRNVARETRVVPAGGEPALRQAALKRLEWYDVKMYEASLMEAQLDDDLWTLRLRDEDARSFSLSARALVIAQAQGAETLSRAVKGLEQLRPARRRIYAQIDIDDSLALVDADPTLSVHGDWAVRAQANAAAELPARAYLSGAVFSDSSWHEAHSQDLQHSLNDALTEAGFRARPGASWSFATVAAPFATISDRDAALGALNEVIAQHPMLLPVGRALHGDDESAALTHAHRFAVELRRRLLGLEPDEL